MPDDPNEDQTADEGEQSPLDQTLERRLKSHLGTTAGRIVLAVVGVALIALIVGLVRACGGSDDPARSLSEAADKIAEELNDAAVDVGDGHLDDLADEVTDAARRLARLAEPDYSDLEDLDATSGPVWDVNDAVERYMERAATVAEGASSEDRADAALQATRRAALLATGSSWHADWTALALAWWNLDFDQNARRYDEKDAERYFEAARAFADADAAMFRADAAYQVAKAELAVATFESDSARNRARDSLEDAADALDDAEREWERASDDLNYFHDLITWRDR